MDVTIVIIAQSIISIVAGLILKNYLPKYIEQKAENLATKEDIGDITDIVKQVEHKFDLSLKNKEAHNSLLVESMNEYNKRRSSLPFDILSKGESVYIELTKYKIPLTNYNYDEYDLGDELLNRSEELLSELRLLQSMADHLYTGSTLQLAISNFCRPFYIMMHETKEIRHELLRFKNGMLSERLDKNKNNLTSADEFYARQDEIYDKWRFLLGKIVEGHISRYDKVMIEIVKHYESIETLLKQKEQ